MYPTTTRKITFWSLIIILTILFINVRSTNSFAFNPFSYWSPVNYNKNNVSLSEQANISRYLQLIQSFFPKNESHWKQQPQQPPQQRQTITPLLISSTVKSSDDMSYNPITNPVSTATTTTTTSSTSSSGISSTGTSSISSTGTGSIIPLSMETTTMTANSHSKDTLMTIGPETDTAIYDVPATSTTPIFYNNNNNDDSDEIVERWQTTWKPKFKNAGPLIMTTTEVLPERSETYESPTTRTTLAETEAKTTVDPSSSSSVLSTTMNYGRRILEETIEEETMKNTPLLMVYLNGNDDKNNKPNRKTESETITTTAPAASVSKIENMKLNEENYGFTKNMDQETTTEKATTTLGQFENRLLELLNTENPASIYLPNEITEFQPNTEHPVMNITESSIIINENPMENENTSLVHRQQHQLFATTNVPDYIRNNPNTERPIRTESIEPKSTNLIDDPTVTPTTPTPSTSTISARTIATLSQQDMIPITITTIMPNHFETMGESNRHELASVGSRNKFNDDNPNTNPINSNDISSNGKEENVVVAVGDKNLIVEPRSFMNIDDDFIQNFHNVYYTNSHVFDDMMKQYSTVERSQRSMNRNNFEDEFDKNQQLYANDINELIQLFFGQRNIQMNPINNS